MSSLKELCLQNIADTVYNAPPGIQEIVMGETREKVEEKVRKDILPTVDLIAKENVADLYSWMIPQMISELVMTMTTNGGFTIANYVNRYSNVDSSIVEKAFEIASESVSRIDSHLTFGLAYNGDENNYDSDNSDNSDYSHDYDVDYDDDYL